MLIQMIIITNPNKKEKEKGAWNHPRHYKSVSGFPEV